MITPRLNSSTATNAATSYKREENNCTIEGYPASIVVEMQRENTGSIWSEVFLHADVLCEKKHYASDLKYDHEHVVVR